MRSMRTSRWAMGLACIVLATSVASAQTASFAPLGDLPGGIFASGAEGVSADGSTVVGYGWTEWGNQAFRWDAVHGMQGLGDLSGSGRYPSGAYGVSADGSVVVGSSRTLSRGEQAFRWDAVHGMQELGDLPGGADGSTAFDVSADGTVVVGTSSSASNQGPGGRAQAFRWDAVHGMQGLGDLAGGKPSWALAVSADGSVTSGTGYSDFGKVAYLWEDVRGVRGLGDLTGGFEESFSGYVSSDGSVVVGASHSASGLEAFRWDAVNGIQGLGDLPGGDFRSQAIDVTGDGSIVIGDGESASGTEAFIWDAVHGMRELDVYLISLGADLDGWSGVRAAAISDDGSVIVGTARNPDGQWEAWVADVPEPELSSLIGAGVALVAGIARRRRVGRSGAIEGRSLINPSAADSPQCVERP